MVPQHLSGQQKGDNGKDSNDEMNAAHHGAMDATTKSRKRGYLR